MFLFLPVVSTVAQDLSTDPSWLLFEKGMRAWREGDFGGSLRFFQLAAEKEAVYPEAEYRIGIIYEKEGQPDLAERQYKKALEMSRALYIPEDKYEILYRLSGLYLLSGRYPAYEETLLTILDEESTADAARIRNEHAWCSVLVEQGLDKLLYLYRLDLTYSLRATSELGVYYYKAGDYRAAYLKNLMAVLTGYSVIARELLLENPDFEFPATEQDLIAVDDAYYYHSLETPDRPFSGAMYLLDWADTHPSVKEYLIQTEFYRSLYYLGMSLFALGHTESARSIFDHIRHAESAGVWKNRARGQFENPRIDSTEIIY